VFHLKKTAIMEDIYKNGVFGHAVAYVYTIEFQKRGLPHIHILIFLLHGQKLLTPEEATYARRHRFGHLGSMARPRHPTSAICDSEEVHGARSLRACEQAFSVHGG
jgi:hypothetical protein